MEIFRLFDVLRMVRDMTETVSGLDNTNSGDIVPVYRFVVRNLSTVHGLIPRFRVIESPKKDL